MVSQAQRGEEHERPQSAASTVRPYTLGDTEGHKMVYKDLRLLPFDRQRMHCALVEYTQQFPEGYQTQ